MWYTSATKLTLILVMLTLCGNLTYLVVSGGDIEMTKLIVEIFKVVCVSIVSFYFGQKTAVEDRIKSARSNGA
jgi:hypothetical protein